MIVVDGKGICVTDQMTLGPAKTVLLHWADWEECPELAEAIRVVLAALSDYERSEKDEE